MTPTDQRRLRDGQAALDAPQDLADRTLDQLHDLRRTLFDGLAAMQSLDDLGSPEANEAAGRTCVELGRRLDAVEAKIVVRSRPSRLEDGIALSCCGQPCRLAGNLALRGAGSPVTRLAYECVRCFRRLQVVDAWDQPSAEQLAVYDETP